MRHFSSGFCHSSALMEQGANINCYYCCSRNQKGKKKINCIIIVGEKGGRVGGRHRTHFRLFLSWRFSTAHSPGKGAKQTKTRRKWFAFNCPYQIRAPSGNKNKCGHPFLKLYLVLFMSNPPPPPNSSYWQEKTKSCRSDVQAQSVPSSNGEIFGVAIFC